METIIRGLFDPHLFPPEAVFFLDYLRYSFILISAVMFVSIIYFVIRASLLREKYIKDILEFTQTAPYSEIKIPKNWNRLKKQSESEDLSDRKMAIIETDEMVGKVLKEMGYDGESLEEDLREVSDDIIPNKDNLIEVHKIREELLYDPNYDLSIERTREIMDTYQETLEDLQFLN